MVMDASNSQVTMDGTKVWGVNQLTTGSGVTVTNTTTLSSHPTLDTSHPWSSSGSTTPTPPKDTTPTDPTSPSAPTSPTAGFNWTGTNAADSKTGGAGADHFWGAGGNDKLLGAAGNDTLEGQGGADTLVGGQGNDLLIGGGGNDVYKLESHGGADRIQGFANHNYVGEHDYIDLTSLGVTKANFASMVSITDSADGALIKVGDTSATVLGMHASSFNSSDFLLG